MMKGRMGIILSYSFILFLALSMALSGIIITSSGEKNQKVNIPENDYYSSNPTIQLGEYVFDVKEGPKIRNELTLSSYQKGLNGYYIVQFTGPVQQVWKYEIERLGANIGDYVPVNGFIVKMNQQVKNNIEKLSFVNYVGIYQPAFKIPSNRVNMIDLEGNMVCASSLDYIGYEGLNKKALKMGQGNNWLTVDIILHKGENPNNIAALIGKSGGNVIDMSDSSVRAEVSTCGLQVLAFLNEVEYIMPYYGYGLCLSDTAWTEQSKVSGSTPVWDNGLTGAGVVVGLADTGVNTDHEHFYDPAWGGSSSWTGPSPTHRKIVGYHLFGDNNVDYQGHGTFDAGVIAGNGAYVDSINSNRYGMAYDAKISFCDIGKSDDGSGTNDDTLGGIPMNIGDLYSITQNDDANIFVMPMKTYSLIDDIRTYTEGTYSDDSMNTDEFMWYNKDFITLFPVGGDRGALIFDGPPYNNTLSSMATGKNSIAVAAHDAGATGWDDISAYSSWGPTLGPDGTTATGRLKPTIASTGNGIQSACTDGNRNGILDTDYITIQGTSMAASVAGGDMALISQYYRDGYYPALPSSPNIANGFVPSAALLKATMINGAVDSVSGSNANVAGHEYTLNGHSMDYPNCDQGWGIVDLDNSLEFNGDSRKLWVDDNTCGLITGMEREYKLVANAGEPLEISLVWTDYPGIMATQGTLVNDLDLTVVDPLNNVYLGNNYGSTSRESDPVNPAGYDHTNPLECALIDSPISGEWTIRVSAANIPLGPQPYALVITGNLNENYGWVKLDKPVYTIGDTMTIEVNDKNVVAGSLQVEVTSTIGDSETVILTEIAANARRFIGTITLNIQNIATDDGWLCIEGGGEITVLYDDISPVHSSYAYASTDVSGPAISNVFVTDISNTGAIVHWTTDVPSTSQVYYGTNIALGSQTDIDNDMVLEHSVPINGLSDFQDYYFDVESKDIGGLTTRDTNGGEHYIFKTEDQGDILLVFGNRDGFDEYYNVKKDWTDALDAYGWSYNIWHNDASGNPSLTLMQSYKAIIWQVGHNEYPAFDSLQRFLIKSYQDGGGRLWVVSHDVMWSLDEQANSGYDTPATEQFIRGQMHANWVADEITFSALNGVGGDPISGTYLGGVSYSPFRDGGAGDTVDYVGVPNDGTIDTIWNNNGPTPGPSGNRWVSSANNGSAGVGVWGGTPSKFVGSFHEWSDIVNQAEREDILDKTIQWLIGEDHADIQVDYPDGGETVSGMVNIQWSLLGNPPNTFDVLISDDGGQSYICIASNLDSAIRSFNWDTTVFSNGINYIVKVIGYNNNCSGFDVSNTTFYVDNGVIGDSRGPVIMAGSIRLSDVPIYIGHTLDITAVADDSLKGNSNIGTMEIYVDGTSPADFVGNMMPFDAFDSPTETAYMNYLVIDSLGTHVIYVRARDTAGNWGGFESRLFYVIQGPPIISIISPTDDEIIYGSYDVQWTATDLFYDDATLDIKIEYSDDGGNSWAILEDGMDNNDGSHIWDTTIIADGVNCLIRISATNGLPMTSQNISEPFSIDNIPNDQWFLQVESSGPFKDLDMKPVETTPNILASPALNIAGNSHIGTWETTSSHFGAIDGIWDFNVYGFVEDSGTLEGNLFAVVKDGTSATLDTTVNDNENIGGFATTHLFTWSDSLTGTITGTTTIRVELWINVVTPSGGPTTATYRPTDTEFSASFWDANNISPFSMNTEYPFDATMETQTSSSNDIRAESVDPGGLDEIFTMCEVTTAIDPAIISNIDMTFEGQGNQATDFEIWAYNGDWVQIGTEVTAGASTDITITRSITSDFADYVIGGVFTWGCYQTDSSELVRVDLLETIIDYTLPLAVFNQEYDYGDAQSNVVIGWGQSPQCSINLTDYSAGDWAFVSFPDDISGSPPTILDDSINGDDGTTWDVVKFYDSEDPTDPWKTYRTGVATNDLVNIDCTMGLWIHLTTNGGDQLLSLGTVGIVNGASINLHTGWNLVGYPSNTAMDADTTLPPQADFITTYNAGMSYLIEDFALTPGAVTMSEENAYWVHVVSDCVWVL